MWEQIKDFPNYEVSDLGEVRNISLNKLITAHDNGLGYFQVKIRNDTGRLAKYVHRLVAEAYLPNTNPELEVHHKDHDKSNNRLENLCWVTKSENIRLARAFHTAKINNTAKINSICPQCKMYFKHKKYVDRVYCSNLCKYNSTKLSSIDEFVILGNSFIIWAMSNYPMTYLAKLCKCSDNGLRKRAVNLLGFLPDKVANSTNRPNTIDGLYAVFVEAA